MPSGQEAETDGEWQAGFAEMFVDPGVALAESRRPGA